MRTRLHYRGQPVPDRASVRQVQVRPVEPADKAPVAAVAAATAAVDISVADIVVAAEADTEPGHTHAARAD